MRAERILRKLLAPCLAFLHAKQLNVLVVITEAVFRSSRLSLTALGRAIKGSAHPKHRIKRVDRFLANAALRAARIEILKHVARWLLRGVARPIVVIDWTQIVDDEYALWAGVPFLGRTVPLYVEAHTIRAKVKRRIHERFLRCLREVLPQGSRPIVVIDAEFCTPFFKACREHGFEFVVRLRSSAILRGRDVAYARDLAATAGARPRCIGLRTTYDAARQGEPLRIVVGAKPRRQCRPVQPNDPYRKRALEAWVLATSLHDLAASQVVAIYATRMQIEEMFRDLKDPRYGWAFNLTGTRDPQRLNLLVLVGSLALLTALLAGAAAEQQDFTRRLQANTERRRRVLSVFRVGLLVIAEFREQLSVSLALAQSSVLQREQRRLTLRDANRLPFICCSKFRLKGHL